MKRIRLLGPSLAVMLAGTLALAACNSSSVSGTQSNRSNTTQAETKSGSGQPNGPQLQGLVDAAIAKTK